MTGVGHERLGELGLIPGGYHLVVARFEPENHVDVLVEGYIAERRGPSARRRRLRALLRTSTRERMRALAASDPRVRLLGGVWDQGLLDQLYVGRPHLPARALGRRDQPVAAARHRGVGPPPSRTTSSFNREVLGDAGRYFRTVDDVAARIAEAESDPAACADRGRALAERATQYDWDEVTDGYERLALDLADRSTPGPRPFARRRHAPEWAWSAPTNPAERSARTDVPADRS